MEIRVKNYLYGCRMQLRNVLLKCRKEPYYKMADGRDNGLPEIDGESPSEFADCSVRISNDISGKKMKQILFDFSKNRKYNLIFDS